MLEITFKTSKMQKIFNSKKLLDKTYGRNAKYIKLRIALLGSCTNLNEVPTEKPERFHQLEGKKKGKFAVTLKEPFRLIFEPTYKPIPEKKDGGFDLKNITAIRIIAVEDYHK